MTFRSPVDTHIRVGRAGNEMDLELALEVVTEGRKGLRRVGGDFSLEAADAAVAEAESVHSRSRDWVHGSGVQGLGIGEKLTHGEPTGELALRVYVEKKKPMAKVANPVPKGVVVPGARPEWIRRLPVRQRVQIRDRHPCVRGCHGEFRDPDQPTVSTTSKPGRRRPRRERWRHADRRTFPSRRRQPGDRGAGVLRDESGADARHRHAH